MRAAQPARSKTVGAAALVFVHGCVGIEFLLDTASRTRSPHHLGVHVAGEGDGDAPLVVVEGGEEALVRRRRARRRQRRGAAEDVLAGDGRRRARVRKRAARVRRLRGTRTARSVTLFYL